MSKIIYRIEKSFEPKDSHMFSDVLAAVMFLAAMGACLNWLSLSF